MTNTGGRLYLSQYDDLVAGRFGVQPPSSIWRSTVIDEDFNGTGFVPSGTFGYYYNEFKQECIKGKRINDLMDWLDDIVVYHRLFDSNYTPSGVDVTSTGFSWKINDGLSLVDYTPVSPSSYTGQLDGYPWNDDYIWKQLRGAITLVCQNVNIVPPHDMGEFDGGEKDWFKYLQTIDIDSKNRFVSYLNQYYQNVTITEDMFDGHTRYTIEGSGVICPSRWLLSGWDGFGFYQESIIGFQNTAFSGGYGWGSETYALDKNPITESTQGTGDGIWLPQTSNKNQPTPLNKKTLNEAQQPYYELGQYGKPFKTEYLQYFPDTSGVEKGLYAAGNTTRHIKPHDEMVFTHFSLSKSGGAQASGDLRNYDDVDQYGNYTNLWDYINWYRKATPLNNTASGTYTYDIVSIHSDVTQNWTYGITYYGMPTYDWDKPIQNEYWTDFNVPTKRQRDDMSKFVEPTDGWMFNGTTITYGTGWGGSFTKYFVANFVVKVPKINPSMFLGGQSDKKYYYMGIVKDSDKVSNHNYDSWTDVAFTYLGHTYYYNHDLKHFQAVISELDFSSSTLEEYDTYLDVQNGIYDYRGTEFPYTGHTENRSQSYIRLGEFNGNYNIFNQKLYTGSINNLLNFTEVDLGVFYATGSPDYYFCNQNVWNDGDNGESIYVPCSIILNSIITNGDPLPTKYNGRDDDWLSFPSDLTKWRKLGLPLGNVFAPGSQTLWPNNQAFYTSSPTTIYNWDNTNQNFVQQPIYIRDVPVFLANDYNNQFYINAYGGLANSIANRVSQLVVNKTNVLTKYEGQLTNIYKSYSSPTIPVYTWEQNYLPTLTESDGCIWGTSGNVLINTQTQLLVNSNDTTYVALQASVAAGASTATTLYQSTINSKYVTVTADWTDANADEYYTWPTERSDWLTVFPPNLANNMRESLQNEYNKNDTANQWRLSETVGTTYIGNVYQYYNSVSYNYLYPRLIYDASTGGYINQPDTVVNGKSTFYYNDVFASGKYEQKMYGCYTYLGQSSLRNKLGVQFVDNQAKVKVNTIFGVANTLLDGKQGASNEAPASTYNHNHFYQYHKDEHWDSSATYKFSYGFINDTISASSIIEGIRGGKFTPICQSTGGMQWVDLSNGQIHRTLEEVEVDLTSIVDMKPPASTSGNYYLVFLHYVDPIDLTFKEPKVWWEQPLVDEETFNYYGQRYGFTVAPHVDSLKTVAETQNVVSVPRLGPVVEHTVVNNTVDVSYTAGNYTTNNQLYLKTTIGVGSDHHYTDYLTYYLLPSNGHYEYKLNDTDHFTQYYSPSAYTALGSYVYDGRFSDYNNYGVIYDSTPHGVWNTNQTNTVSLPILPPALMLKIDKPLYVI